MASTSKLTIQSDQADLDFATLVTDVSREIGSDVTLKRNDTHAVLGVASDKTELAREAIAKLRADVRIMSDGDAIEIYKEVGLPKDVAQRFQLSTMSGSHGDWSYAYGDRICRDHRWCASVFNGSGSMPCAQTVHFQIIITFVASCAGKVFGSKVQMTQRLEQPISLGKCKKAQLWVKPWKHLLRI